MSLAALIHKRFSILPTIKPGSGGVFDVVVDGKKIFSKHEEGRFPYDDDLLDELAAL